MNSSNVAAVFWHTSFFDEGNKKAYCQCSTRGCSAFHSEWCHTSMVPCYTDVLSSLLALLTYIAQYFVYSDWEQIAWCYFCVKASKAIGVIWKSKVRVQKSWQSGVGPKRGRGWGVFLWMSSLIRILLWEHKVTQTELQCFYDKCYLCGNISAFWQTPLHLEHMRNQSCVEGLNQQ